MRGETHAWNVVFDDNGNAIPVDCTWKSGNPGADYFGRSKEFAMKHVADADEVYRDYMPNASEINASVVDSKETIDKAISTMNYKFGQGEGLKRIKRFYLLPCKVCTVNLKKIKIILASKGLLLLMRLI